MKNKSLIALVFSYLIIFLFGIFYYPKWNQQGTESTISYDVSGYYLYLPSLFIYHDIKKLEFYPAIHNTYHPTPVAEPTNQLPNGDYILKYPCGAALFYTPFFFIAHGYASLSHYPADGYSKPYAVALSLGCMLYAFIGLWLLRKILLHYFDDLTTAITILLLVGATNYLNYAAIDSPVPHNLLFTLYTILIWNTIRFYENLTVRKALLIGIVCGLAVITRPTEIICLLIPLLWGIRNFSALKKRIQYFIHHAAIPLSMLAGALFMGSLQIIYWKSVTGEFLFYSYVGEGFNWLHPYLKEGLFSYRKGWFVYTPLMVFIVPGFFFLYKKRQEIFWPVLLFTVINIYISFSWTCWWYGGSLGQRSMVQSYALLAFPLAIFVKHIITRKKIFYIVFSLPAIFCGLYNLILTIQAHGQYTVYEPEYINKTYFWVSVGRLHVDWQAKKYLDLDEKFKGQRRDVQEIYFNDIETDTTHIDTFSVITGKKSLFVNFENQYTYPYSIPIPPAGSEWLRLSADFYFPYKEWNTWKMTQFIVQFKNNSEVVKSGFIRIQRIMEQGEIKNLYYDVKIPEAPYNRIEFYLWNADGQSTVYMDNIRVESFH